MCKEVMSYLHVNVTNCMEANIPQVDSCAVGTWNIRAWMRELVFNIAQNTFIFLGQQQTCVETISTACFQRKPT